MTAPDHQRKEHRAKAMFERQALAYHYGHCRRSGDPAFSPDDVVDVIYPGAIGIVLMASRGARLTALYAFEPTDIGYRFRRLTTELEGRALRKALLGAEHDAPLALAELGLSRREIAVITQLDRRVLAAELASV